ncbi:MAG: MFS transporter [Planctomycetota bacterium]|nr:MAG: MFS transporter [Planctomycetota bacterium]
MLIPCAYTFIDRFCVGVVISSFVLFLADCHALGPDERSRLLAMFLVPFALLVYPAGRLVDRLGVTLPLAGGSAAFGLLFAAYGFLPREWLPVAMFASGVLSAAMFAPTLTLIAAWSDAERRGAACARFNAAGALGFVCGPLIAGTICHSLADVWGARAAYQTAFIIAGMAEFACAAATLPWLLRIAKRDARGQELAAQARFTGRAEAAATAGG